MQHDLKTFLQWVISLKLKFIYPQYFELIENNYDLI